MAESKSAMQKQREQRRAQGWRDVNIWLTPEGQQRIARLTDPGESLSTLIDRALAALDTIHSRPLYPEASESTSEPPEYLQSLIAREVSRYITSDGFRDNLFIPLFKQVLTSALPSDVTSSLPSDVTRLLTREPITITALPPPATPDKPAILHKLRTMHTEGFSLQAMADRFNLEGVPTLSGRGRWQKGTVGKLLSEETS
jgi:hypothetical protein